MRILFLSGWYPDPPDNGSKLRIINLLRGLAQRHDVSLLSFSETSRPVLAGSELFSLCREVQVAPAIQFAPRSWRARLGFFSLTPRSVVATYSREMEQRVRAMLRKSRYDLVIASQLGVAAYSHCFAGLPALLEEVEVALLWEQFARARTLGERLRYGLTWAKQKRYLKRLLRHFQFCTVVSEREKQLLAAAVPGFSAVEVIPNCIKLADYASIEAAPQRRQLIFTGSFRYFANYDGMTWFLQEVYPLLRNVEPDVQLIITGDHANLPLPQAENVTLTGFVEDIRPLIASSWVSLSPLRLGGGTRLKILEAMALRTPVVATSKGAEGLGARHGEHLLVADTPQEYAAALGQLLRDAALRQRLADNAYRFVAQNYDCAVTVPRFLDLVERVAHV